MTVHMYVYSMRFLSMIKQIFIRTYENRCWNGVNKVSMCPRAGLEEEHGQPSMVDGLVTSALRGGGKKHPVQGQPGLQRETLCQTGFVILNLSDVGRRKVNLNKSCKMHLNNREKNTVKLKLTTGQNGLACTQLGGARETGV